MNFSFVRRNRSRHRFDGWSIESLEPRLLLAGDLQAAAVAPAMVEPEVVFIDAGVDDLGQVVDAIDSNAEIILLDFDRDPIRQITEVLVGRSGIASVHVLCHGRSGEISMANRTIDEVSLHESAPDIQTWRSALADGADILLYGCETGHGEAGRRFIETLAALTDADVAASTDATGAKGRGGDWDLEATVGRVDSPIVLVEAKRERYSHTLPITIRAAGTTGEERIDHVDVDGITLESESPDVFSTGTWLPEDGVAAGFRESEYLHTNGAFDYPVANLGRGDDAPDGSELVVRARGDEGTERFELLIGGLSVGTFDVTTETQSFRYTHTDSVSADDVRIEFLNDDWDEASGIDANLVVDSIFIDGVAYETEDPTVFSTGTWKSEDGITSGFRESEILHTNGYFQFAFDDGSADEPDPTEPGSLLRFRVSGDEGTERFDLQIDGETVSSYAAGTGYVIYRFAADDPVTAEQVRIAFTNDEFDPDSGVDANLNVDWLEIDGSRIQTTQGNVLSTGTWTPEDGIVDGFGRGQKLHTNGHFQYAESDFSGVGSTITVRASGDVGGEELALQIDERDVLFATVTNEFIEYTFVADSIVEANQVRVRYTNDVFQPDIDRNLNVDWIEIDGVRFESEAETVFSTGTFGDGGIVVGFGRGSTLHVQGYFEYGRDADEPQNFNGLPVFEQGGNLYFRTSGGVNWEQAQAEAESFGGNLVTISDATEEAFLQSTFGANGVWIGLADLAGDGEFRWVGDEQPTYRNWAPGHPLAEGNDFVLMNAGTDFRWETFAISETGHFGIIEIVGAV